MSLRISHPENPAARRFCLTFAYGKGSRSISMRPLLFYIIVGVLPVLGLWYLFATVYLIFRDDMLASLMSRQTAMQYAYEDRVAALRGEIDHLTSRRLLDEAALNTKMEDLVSRQARIERRSAVMASLAERVLPKADLRASTTSQTTAPVGQAEPHFKSPAPYQSQNPLLTGAFSQSPPQGVSAFAPMQPAAGAPDLLPHNQPAKPRPDGFDLRRGEDASSMSAAGPGKVSASEMSGDGHQTLAHIAADLDRIEADQNRMVARLQAPIIGEMTRVRAVLAEAGLSASRLAIRDPSAATERGHESDSKGGAGSAVGGPFIPYKPDTDGSAFEREANSLQDAIFAVENLRLAMTSIPLRKPLIGDPEVTSGFGGRLDPFFGRLAMHTGIDLREDYGSAIHATASGKVTIAGPDGGYGNMVEIDHGNGLSTRYAHMSAILVNEGQTVQAGQVIGRIGMTGRTTGAHLHYETRIDGEAVDPLRFLKAGSRLFPDSENRVQAD